MSFIDHFSTIEDPRLDINIQHNLMDILFLTMSATLSGAEGWEEINVFGKQKLTWLRKHRPFKNKIPSASTLKRIISVLESQAITQSYMNWINSLRQKQDLEIIAFDGKTLRHSYQNSKDPMTALHSISAYATEQGITIGITDSKTKKNEIAGVLELINHLELESSIITADAMSCNKIITQAISEKKADYVLQIKNNQKKLLTEIQAYYHKIRREQPELIQQNYAKDIHAGHGRIETRECTQLLITDWFDNTKDWSKLKSIIEIVRTREDKKTGKSSTETAYYISSLDINPEQLNHIVRRHWAIENNLHYVLDVTFKEDANRIREAQATKNMAVFRRLSLAMIKLSQIKGSIKSIIKRCGWNDDVREQVLFS